jgi:sugar-specific transcriptional regulator TrmB
MITKNGDEATALLQGFGLAGQEAAVYLALLAEGELNGYEVAKSLSISRSNAYTALAGLTEKGAAWTIEGTPVRYTAVRPEEYCADRLRALAASRDRLLAILPKKRETPGSYATIRGRDRILDRLRHLIAEAEERVYLALEGPLLELYAAELAGLRAAGKKVVIITDRPAAAFAGSGGALPAPDGSAVYLGAIPPGQIRAIADSRSVMTGELGTADTEATCLYSDHPNLVELFKTSLRNEIRLIELGETCRED